MLLKKFKPAGPTPNDKPFVVEKYCNDLKKSNPLSPEDEIDLVYKAQLGDIHAMERVITANLRFVFLVAKSYQGRGLELADLINEGNIGLINALKKFDPTRGFKFSSFAVSYIKTYILDSVNRNGGNLKIPDRSRIIKKIFKFSSSFLQKEEREPTVYEIAQGIDISENRISSVFGALKTISFCTHFDGEEKNLLDTIGVEDDFLFFEKRRLEEILSCLDEKEKNIVWLRINGGMFTAISEGLECSEEIVARKFYRAIEKIKSHFSEQELKSLVS